MTARNHWWWDIPEFRQAQRDHGFRAWVDSIELGMDLGEEPFDELIPGLSVADPFADEGLQLAEATFLDIFCDRHAMDQSSHTAMRFVRYLG